MPTDKEVDYNEILDSLDEYISSFDRDWNFLYLNKKTAKDFGFKQSDLIGKNFWQTFPRFVGTNFEKVCHQVMDKRKAQVFEWKTIYAKPSIREFTVSPSAQGITVHGKDITERKKAEEAIIASEAQFHSLYNNSIDAILLTIPNGAILSANKATQKLFGMTEQEIKRAGRKDLLVIDERALKAIKEREETGYGHAELTFKRKDGSTFEGEVSSGFFKDVDGNTRTSMIIRDISERKKAEEALEEAKNNLQDILNGIDDGITLVGLDGKVLDANKTSLKLLGLAFNEFIGINVYDVIIDEDKQQAINGASEVLKTGKVVNEVRVKRKNKPHFWAEISVTALCDRNGKPTFFLGVTRDITERKQMEQKIEEYTKNLEKLVEERTKQLKDSERLATIGATAGMVGHDIRNPLQAIVSELYLAKQNMDEAPDGKGKQDAIDSINFMQEQVDYINKIVADLQDYARNTKPTSRDVNMKDLIDGTFSALTIPSNIVAKCTVQGNPQLKSDPDYLRRIMTNLSTNAIQAMPNGGKLTLNVERNNRLVEISVSDTGNGIPKEIQDRIFTPLFTTKSKGQGFGLPVVKKFVEQLGGTITYESQEGKGTTFRIELPIEQ